MLGSKREDNKLTGSPRYFIMRKAQESGGEHQKMTLEKQAVLRGRINPFLYYYQELPKNG